MGVGRSGWDREERGSGEYEKCVNRKESVIKRAYNKCNSELCTCPRMPISEAAGGHAVQQSLHHVDPDGGVHRSLAGVSRLVGGVVGPKDVVEAEHLGWCGGGRVVGWYGGMVVGW